MQRQPQPKWEFERGKARKKPPEGVAGPRMLTWDPGPDPNFVQIYATTLFSRRGTAPFEFLSVPAKAFPERSALDKPEELIKSLGFKLREKPSFTSKEELAKAVLNVIPRDSSDPFREGYAAGFATYLAGERVIPFEQSPLDLASLGGLLAPSANTVAIGAFVGIVVGFGTPPLMFVTVPTGMILCGVAEALSKALSKGLEKRLGDLFGTNPRQPKPGSKAIKPTTKTRGKGSTLASKRTKA